MLKITEKGNYFPGIVRGANAGRKLQYLFSFS